MMKKLHLVLTLALALGLLVGLITGVTVSAAYPGKKIQIPSINVENGWSTWIHAQNVGDDDTGAVVFFWGEHSGLCPPNSPGPAAVVCQMIVENGVESIEVLAPEGGAFPAGRYATNLYVFIFPIKTIIWDVGYWYVHLPLVVKE